MKTASSVLSFLAVSAFVLAPMATANSYGQPTQEYQPPAYRKPADGLVSGYYGKSCPDMEGIVQRAVKKAFAADYTIAAGLIRLFFHDFAVGVCMHARIITIHHQFLSTKYKSIRIVLIHLIWWVIRGATRRS